MQPTEFTMSAAAIRYFSEANKMNTLNSFLSHISDGYNPLKLMLDAEVERIWNIEFAGGSSDVDIASLSRQVKPERLLDSFTELFNELNLCRCADNFLSFISELLIDIFSSRPETLHAYADKDFKVGDVLRLQSREELLFLITKKIVRDYAYKSFHEVNEQLKKRHNLILVEREEDAAVLSELIAIRNIIVHNRGIVNEEFFQRVKQSDDVMIKSGRRPYRNGEHIELHWIVVGNLVRTANRSVVYIDQAASKQFHLSQKAVPESCQTSVFYAANRMRDLALTLKGARGWVEQAEAGGSGPYSMGSEEDTNASIELDPIDSREIEITVRNLVTERWRQFNEIQQRCDEANSPEGRRRRALEIAKALERKDPDIARRARSLVERDPVLVILLGIGKLTIEEAERRARETDTQQ